MTKVDVPFVYEEWEWSERPVAECKSDEPVGKNREYRASSQEKRLWRKQEKAIDYALNMQKKNEPLIRELINQGYTEEDAVTLAAKARALEAFSGDIPVSPALEKEIENEDSLIREELARRGVKPGSTPWIQTMDAFRRRRGDLREESRRAMISQASDIYQRGHFTGLELSDRNRYNKIASLMNMATPYLNISRAYAGSAAERAGYRTQLNDMLYQGLQLRHAANMGKAQMQSDLWSGIGEGMSMAGGSCCFIFIAGHGYLHPIVRRYRDEHMTKRNRRGYYWLADRLVPLMERFKAVRRIVRFVMVDPMTSYGKYYYGINRIGVIFTPITSFWLRIFTLLGFRKPYRRKGTAEIV